MFYILQFLLDTVQNNLYNGGEKLQRALRQLGEQNIVLEVFKWLPTILYAKNLGSIP